MPEPAQIQLLSSETITSFAELWKIGVCVLIAFVCHIFRHPISQILLNLRKIRSKYTEIELAPPTEERDTQEPLLPLSKKAPPEKPTEQTPETAIDGDSLFSEMLDAINRRENDRARELRDKWIERDSSKRRQNEVFYLHLLCKFQKNSEAVQELQQLRHDEAYSDQFPIILMTLGTFYESTDQHESALQFFMEWEKVTSNPLGKANAVVARSRIVALSESSDASLSFLLQSISRFEDHECLAQIYHQIAETYRSMENEVMRCVALEKVVQYRPTDSAIRLGIISDSARIGVDDSGTIY